MLNLQRAAFKFSARSPWLRTRPPGLRAQRNPHAQRNSSNSSQGNHPKDSSTQPSTTPNKPPPRSSDQVPVGETGQPVEPVDIPIQLWYHRLGPVLDFFKWFHRTQEKRPYTVQICTVLATYLSGDLLAQDIGGEPYDPWRTLRMLTIGAIAAIPGYKWYDFDLRYWRACL